jgi:dTDP-4-dehydrorhamnose 3,5-epimerase
MRVIETAIAGLVLVEPRVFRDERGFFYESFQRQRFIDSDLPADFVQDNHSRSTRGVLRGLHFQRRRPQGKLVSVVHGEVFDVAVDTRSGSATFGRWFGVRLSADAPQQLYIPPGFAHGFCVLSDTAEFTYKCTDYYDSDDEGGIVWDDPDLGIEWPISSPLVSAKDSAYPRLAALKRQDLPQVG